MATTYYVDPAVGDDGNLGTSEGAGNAWQTLQHAADTAVAGDTCYIKASATITLSAKLDIDTTAGANLTPIQYIGYTTTIADNGKVSITKTGAVTTIFDISKNWLIFRNFDITGGTSYAIQEGASQANIFANIKASCVGGTVYACGGYNSSAHFGCEYHTATNGVLAGIFGECFYGCYIHDTTTGMQGINDVIFCLLEANTTGISGGIRGAICNNIIDGGTTGVISGSFSSSHFVNNIFSNLSGAAISITGNNYTPVQAYYNAFYNVGSQSNLATGRILNSITLTADPYTNRVAHDFSLNSTAGGGAACRGLGFPITVGVIGTRNNYISVGAYQPQDSGAIAIFPTEAQVKNTITFGPSGSDYTGNVTLPASGDVRTAVSYGASGTEFTGSYAAAAPTFAGVTQIERIGGGAIKVYWSAGTGSISGYRIYVRPGSSTNLFTSTYRAKEVPSTVTSTVVKVGADNTTFFDGTQAIYIGVRAFNEAGFGAEDTNTVSYYVTPDGTGSTYIKVPQEVWSL